MKATVKLRINGVDVSGKIHVVDGPGPVQTVTGVATLILAKDDIITIQVENTSDEEDEDDIVITDKSSISIHQLRSN